LSLLQVELTDVDGDARVGGVEFLRARERRERIPGRFAARAMRPRT
jgi:hypothetical protein